jgi:hypothetical protein
VRLVNLGKYIVHHYGAEHTRTWASWVWSYLGCMTPHAANISHSRFRPKQRSQLRQGSSEIESHTRWTEQLPTCGLWVCPDTDLTPGELGGQIDDGLAPKCQDKVRPNMQACQARPNSPSGMSACPLFRSRHLGSGVSFCWSNGRPLRSLS